MKKYRERDSGIISQAKCKDLDFTNQYFMVHINVGGILENTHFASSNIVFVGGFLCQFVFSFC